MPIRIPLVAILAASFCLSGCAHTPPDAPPPCSFHGPADRTPAGTRARRLVMLEQDLLNLHRDIDWQEVKNVAQLALDTSVALRHQYEVTATSAVAHNLEVVSGRKKRGLCVHWTRDLLDTLRALQLQTLTLFWAVAHEGNVLREHSTVVIAARGEPFESGLVLDPWRNLGCLHWTPVKNDGHPWKQASEY